MSMKYIAVIFLCSIFVFSVIHFLGKIKKPFKRAFVSVLCGPAVLVVVNLFSSITSVVIPITQLSLSVTMMLGVPGVALMTLSTLIFS